MKIIVPMPVTDAEFVSSNVTEDDYAVWASGTTYAADDYVIVIGTTHKVYQSAQAANTGNDPTTDDGTWWTEISATNRWKAFDLKIADSTSNVSSITYSISPSSIVTSAALFGLNAGTVQIEVYDDAGTPVLIYDTTVDLVDTTDVVDWFTWAFGGVDYDSEALFIGIPAYTGYQIDITISAASGNAEVGQIVIGEGHTLGESVDGTSVGIKDFSTKNRDSFGNATVVERAFIDRTDFQFTLRTDNARYVKRILSGVRANPAVYFTDENSVQFGATVFGYYQDFSIPLSAGGQSFASLEVEGLV